MNYVSVEVDRFNKIASGLRAVVSIDKMGLKKVYEDCGLSELPEHLLEDAFESLEMILQNHLNNAVSNAFEEYMTEFGDTPVETVIEKLIDAGELEKPVRFYIGCESHTAMLGKRNEAGMVPLLFDGSTHWRNETVPYPWDTLRVVFHHEAEKAFKGFYHDIKKSV